MLLAIELAYACTQTRAARDRAHENRMHARSREMLRIEPCGRVSCAAASDAGTYVYVDRSRPRSMHMATYASDAGQSRSREARTPIAQALRAQLDALLDLLAKQILDGCLQSPRSRRKCRTRSYESRTSRGSPCTCSSRRERLESLQQIRMVAGDPLTATTSSASLGVTFVGRRRER